MNTNNIDPKFLGHLIDHRDAVQIVRYLKGRTSYTELAELLDMPRATLQSIIKRGIASEKSDQHILNQASQIIEGMYEPNQPLKYNFTGYVFSWEEKSLPVINANTITENTEQIVSSRKYQIVGIVTVVLGAFAFLAIIIHVISQGV